MTKGSRGSWRLRPRLTAARRRWPSPSLLIPAVMLLTVVAGAAFAPIVAPHDPGTMDLTQRLKPPVFLEGGRWDNILGTDAMGRDVLSRAIYSGRVSLLVGFGAVILAGLIGIPLGLLAGFFGGRIDDVVGRLSDIQLALPTMVLVIFMMAVLGSGVTNVIIVLGIASWVSYARVTRSQVFTIRELEYIDAVRTVGLGRTAIIVRHVFPNVVGPIIVVATFSVASAIMAESALSFLGLGVGPQTPTWGGMLADGRNYMYQAWWLTVFPGIALMITVLAINLLGDRLRDALDPRMKG